MAFVRASTAAETDASSLDCASNPRLSPAAPSASAPVKARRRRVIPMVLLPCGAGSDRGATLRNIHPRPVPCKRNRCNTATIVAAELDDDLAAHLERGNGRTAGGSLERAAGIEPACTAWEAVVLPLNYARTPRKTSNLTRGIF